MTCPYSIYSLVPFERILPRRAYCNWTLLLQFHYGFKYLPNYSIQYLCTLINRGFLYFFNSVSKNVERFERRVLEEFTKMFTESNSFYFSLTGDITNALQRQASREPTVTVNSGSEYVKNIFSRSLKKTSHQRKLRQVFAFQLLNDKIDQNTNFAKLPSAKWVFLV